MRKRILLVFLAMIFVLTSCGQTQVDDPADTNKAPETNASTEPAPVDPEAALEVCGAWEDYLYAAQIKALTEEWGLEYIKAYCEEPSVVGLQRAISAAETVVATLSEIKLPGSDLSSETLSSLADSGVDMSFVPLEFDVLKRAIEEGENAWDSILHSILTESFWEYGIEYIEGWANVRLETESVYNLYRGKMTNAIALSLGESKDDPTWAAWTKKAPILLGESFTWTDDENVLTDELSVLLDRLEGLTVKAAELNGVLSANYGMFDAAIKSEDWAPVYAVAVDLTDHFMPIPMPEWSATHIYSYKYDEAANDAIWTTAGDDLTVCPDGFIFQYDGVTRDEFYSYVNFLGNFGIKYYPGGSTTEGDTISLYYLEYCTMSLKWEGDRASIYFYDNEPLLVPSWYLIYLLMSLN
ncbi:MAG: hypothetical protein E7627_08430 [Ruminococcaceae bacterium]|nr:hypothetical protein [Oscillospiraceae bacterium]